MNVSATTPALKFCRACLSIRTLMLKYNQPTAEVRSHVLFRH
jgi:hypothetical protein